MLQLLLMTINKAIFLSLLIARTNALLVVNDGHIYGQHLFLSSHSSPLLFGDCLPCTTTYSKSKQ